MAKAKNAVEGAGNAFPMTVVNPTSVAFATMPINVTLYSAVVIASDSSCGGCDNSTASIAAINARSAALQAFFTASGGLMYLASTSNRITYYASVPIPATGLPVTAPFTITAAGSTLGLIAADANCCPTHNSFATPASGSAFVIVETDAAGLPETLIVTGGSVDGGIIVVGPPVVAGPPIGVPSLSAWGLAFLALMVTLMGLFTLRRRA